MTPCPSPGALRAHLDEADNAVEAHATDCTDCAADLRRLAEAAGTTAAAFRALDGDATAPPTAGGIEAALEATRSRVDASAGPAPLTAGAGTVTALVPRRSRRLVPRIAAAACAAAVTVAVVGTPAGRQAAADLLDVFRPERIEVVTVDAEGARAGLAALSDIGTVDLPEGLHPLPVADAAQAAAVSGLDVSLPDPAVLAAAGASTDGPPRLLARAPGQVRITLNRDAEPALPAEVDGATLLVDLPGAVAALYPGKGASPLGGRPPVDPDDHTANLEAMGEAIPAFVYAEAGAPSATVEGGATLEQVRSALLALPDLPPDTVAQLEAITDWRRTLPLPLPLDHVAWQEVMLTGGEALVFGDETGVAAAVLWQRDGLIRVVGGALPASGAIAAAETLDG
jgi:hypothetical protein